MVPRFSGCPQGGEPDFASMVTYVTERPRGSTTARIVASPFVPRIEMPGRLLGLSLLLARWDHLSLKARQLVIHLTLFPCEARIRRID